MVVVLKKGLSIDEVAQGKVIEKLLTGEYEDAFNTFNKITRPQLKEVSDEYKGILTKYAKYYNRHKKASRVINQFIDTMEALSEGKEVKRPRKKYKIKYEFPEGEAQPVETPPEAENPKGEDPAVEDPAVEAPAVEAPAVEAPTDAPRQQVTVEVGNKGDTKTVFTEERVRPVPTTEKPKEEDSPTADQVEAEATESIVSNGKTGKPGKTPVKESKGQEEKASVRKIGLLAPHSKNTTEKSVEAAIGETPEEQLKDFKNWFVFDIPDSYTGVGNAKVNPLVKNNDSLQKLGGEGDLMKVSLTEYLLTEGIEEIKDFYNVHPALLKAAFKRDMKRRHMEKTEAEFLAQFDEGSNGLFNQDQTSEERSNWRNIYQVPSGTYDQLDEYPLTEPIDGSIFVDDEITRNKNDFPDEDAAY